MEIVISGRHTEVPDRFRRLAEEKLLKIGQLAPKAQRTDVELSHEKNPRQSQKCERVEITVRGKGPVIRAEASAEDPAAALDLAFGKLQERLRRHRDRRKVHHGRQTPASVRISETTVVTIEGAPDGALLDDRDRDLDDVDVAVVDMTAVDGTVPGSTVPDGTIPSGTAAAEERTLDDSSPIVIRTKDHEARPMTLEQALYEMELVGHDFYLFVDADSSRPSVVYRRRGWSYGVIRLKADTTQQLAATPAAEQNGTRLPQSSTV